MKLLLTLTTLLTLTACGDDIRPPTANEVRDSVAEAARFLKEKNGSLISYQQEKGKSLSAETKKWGDEIRHCLREDGCSLRGEQGEAGERGETGPQGERGTDGEQGEAGEQGPAGTDGEAGEDGQSCELKEVTTSCIPKGKKFREYYDVRIVCGDDSYTVDDDKRWVDSCED